MFDFEYDELIKNKIKIINILFKWINNNFHLIYKLAALILVPFDGHYINIITNPEGRFVKNSFKSFKSYKHDSMKNQGLLEEIIDNDLFSYGQPHILIYRKCK